MPNNKTPQDPLDFIRNIWNSMGIPLPGMVTPTLDVNEIDKRIADLKAVEHWLKVNTNMLQMTIQGLEMQRTTLAAVVAMSKAASSGTEEQKSSDESNPFAHAGALWPWNLMTPSQQEEENSDATTESVKPRKAAPPAEAPGTDPDKADAAPKSRRADSGHHKPTSGNPDKKA